MKIFGEGLDQPGINSLKVVREVWGFGPCQSMQAVDGDSISDLALLETQKSGVVVAPDRMRRQVAHDRNWQMISF